MVGGLPYSHLEPMKKAVEVLEEMGTLVLDDSIPDNKLRKHIFDLLPSEDISRLVEGCRIHRRFWGRRRSSLRKIRRSGARSFSCNI